MRVKGTVSTLRDDLDGSSLDLLSLENFRHLVESNSNTSPEVAPLDGGGWGVTFKHRWLMTQRGQVRRFRTLEAVASLLHKESAKGFHVRFTAISPDQRKLVKWATAKGAL
jgi:hypothetical protein